MENNLDSPKEKIAKYISIGVPVATGVLAIVAIGFAIYAISSGETIDESFEIVKYVFAAMLPLWGTWIGTVLAYYFSKENFESANENVRKLVTQVTTVNEKLQGIKAKDVMIPLSDIDQKDNVFKLENEIGGKKITDLISFLNNIGRNRLPIFINKSLKYIIHMSTFDRFIRLSLEANSSNNYKELTIDHMLKSDDEMIKYSLLKGSAFIGENANLLEAKNKMDANSFCNDVFVTKSGEQSEEVIGWITDKIINSNAIV